MQDDKICDMRNQQSDIAGLESLIDFAFQSGGCSLLSMVEVGSYAGQSMEIFANTGKVKEILCIDPWVPGWDENDPATDSNMLKVEELFDNKMKSVSDKCEITKFKGTLQSFVGSPEYIRFMQRCKRVDLVYIDALHTYDGCKSDILISRYALNPRIGVSGHDYQPGWEDVCRAVNETVGMPDRTFSDSSWFKILRSKND